MESDMLEILLCHTQHIAGVGEEHITSLLVLRHILVLTLLEVLELLLVVALYPTGLIQVDGLPTAFRIVLVLQAILDDLKLQLSHRSDDLTVIKLVDEELSHSLVHQLVDTLLQLLRLHRVIVLDILEQLRREGRQTTEVELLSLGERVANLEHTTGVG